MRRSATFVWLWLGLAISGFFLRAQQVYIPYDTAGAAQREAFVKAFETRAGAYRQGAIRPLRSAKQRRLANKYLKNYFSAVSDEFLYHDELYFNRQLDDYLRRLFDRLVSGSGYRPPGPVILKFSRHPTPNAFSVGEGTIAIHMDLVDRLENEAQLAAVLAHEFSHYYLDHLGQSYRNYVIYLTSKDYRKKVKQVYNGRYGRTEKAERLLKQVLYSRRRKSRRQELEADSLGYIIYVRAGFPPDQYLRSLALLDSVDTERDSLTVAFLRRWFHTASQPFNERWLQREDFSAYFYADDPETDSLKTHPGIPERVEVLRRFSRRCCPGAEVKNEGVSPGEFEKLKKNAPYERLFNLYHQKAYGLSLYHTLKALQHHPRDPFLLKMFVLNFRALTQARQRLESGKYIPAYNPRIHSESMHLFIDFMNNMDEHEMQRLLDDYSRLLRQRHLSNQIYTP